MINNIEKKRYIYVDIAKFIAIFAVVFNHTSVTKYNANFLHINFVFECIFKFLVSIHIPLFLLVSGVVVLGKNYGISDVIKKIFKIIILCMLLNLFYYLMFSFTKNGNIDMIDFLRSSYSSCPYPIIWYLPKIYIPFLIITPLLQNLVKSFDDRHYIFYLFVFLFFKIVIKIFEKVLSLDFCIIDSNLFISDIIFLPLIGYFINKIQIKYDLKKILLIVAIAVFSILLYNYLYPLNPYNYVMTICIFIILKNYEYFFQNINKKVIKIVNNVSKNSLYIYVFHWFVCRSILSIIEKLNLMSPFPFYLSSFLLAIIVLICTNIIINVIKIVCKHIEI